MTFDEYFSRITDEYASPNQMAELRKARSEFFGFIGTVHEEDPFFENYMTSFLEWYVFDRDYTDQDLPPVRLYYRTHFHDFSNEEKEIYGDFTQFRHSMFLAKKVTETGLHLLDFYADEKIKMENHFQTAGFKSGDIFEAILIPFRGKLIFTKSVVFHPPETKSFIKKEMKKICGMELKILQKTILKFKKLRLKLDRYPHVRPAEIYNPEEFNRYA